MNIVPIWRRCLTNTQVCASLSTNLAEKEGLDYVTGLLREVQEEGRDQDSKADHHEEQAPRDSRFVPEVRNQGIPYRQSLGL